MSVQIVRSAAMLLVAIAVAWAPLSAQPGLNAKPHPSHSNATPSLDGDSISIWVGRMLMIGFRGLSLEESDHLARDISTYHLGGVILFDVDVPTGSQRRNIDHPDQVRSLIRSIREISPHPMMVAVDQEGGRVVRLKERRGFVQAPSAAGIAALPSDSIRILYGRQSKALADLGFNVNFAPVVDVNLQPDNPVIGRLGRSYSGDPDVVATVAAIHLDELRKVGVHGVIKHFPGHGSSDTDSHLGMTDVSRTWSEVELIPYRTLLGSVLDDASRKSSASGSSPAVHAVMTAHVFLDRYDPNRPATLSPLIVDGLLRGEIGFDGVVFSDDMQMGAIREHYTMEEAILMALDAGVDVLVFGNNSVYDPQAVPTAHAIIMDALRSGRLSEERIRRSILRIDSMLGNMAY
jgi:beta-N-acetylhexosaminidase